MALADAIKKVGSQVASDALGRITTAYLIVHDSRKLAPGIGAAAESIGQQRATEVYTAGVSAMAEESLAAAGENELIGRALQAGTDAMQSSTASQIISAAGTSSENRTFTVQFNPSELQIYSSVVPNYMPDAQSGGIQSIANATTKPRMELTVPLVFDKMNICDSFMWDKFTGGVSAQSATNLATAVAKSKGEVWTVQPIVEGLIAALRNPFTREATFGWGNFRFRGTLLSVDAQYTMFSTSGRPVRARVNLRLRCELDADKISNWMTEFNEAFGTSGVASAGRVGQSMGNLLNIGY